MKIQIKSAGRGITVPIPTALMFNRLSLSIWLKGIRTNPKIRGYIPDRMQNKAEVLLESLSEEAVYALWQEMQRIKKEQGGWDLVEIETSAGDQVLISL